MRLHSLRLTGVGPFRAMQEIDFDELTSSGLFLIEGPTGSGKTTIIDALVYALFGVVSGGSDDVTRMRIRSSYCDDADPTGVACEFSVDGRRHRITRVPAGCRDPEDPTRKAGSKGPRQVLTEIGPDGVPLGAPLAARKEVDQRIESLLGMTAEQFRQLVVLPQGQFAELLRKTPAERLTSLAPLLEDTFIARVQDDLRLQGDLAGTRRAEAAITTDHAAHRLAGRLDPSGAADRTDTDPIDITDPHAPAQARRDAVHDLMSRLSEQTRLAADERQVQDVRTQQLRMAASSSAALLTALAEVSDARVRVEATRAALGTEDRALEDHEVNDRIDALRRREGSLEAHADWEAHAPARAAERATVAAVRDQHAERAAALQGELEAVPMTRAALERQREEAAIDAAGLAAAAAAEDEAARLVEAARLLADRQAELSRLTRSLDGARARERSAVLAVDTAQQSWERLVAAHRSGSAADLATLLSSGDPCPVCGSCDHPRPAEPSAAEVTRAELDAAAATTTAARTESLARANDVAEALAQHTEAATAVALVEGVVAGRTIHDLEARRQQAQQARSQAQSATELLPALVSRLAGLAEREAELRRSIREAETAAATAAATVLAAEQSDRERQAEIARAIGGAPSAGALLDDIRARIARLTDLRTAIDTLAALTAQLTPEQRALTIDQASRQATDDAAACAEATESLTALADRAAALASALDEAAPLAQAFLSALDQQAAVTEETAAPLALAALVTAGNSRRLPLRAYALQRRFDAVLAAASIQLERMSSGKFSFVSTDETARGQSGLGIQLLDAWTGHLQDPRSLSGGETFYASLALALGLAEVVRGEAGGAQLETLFVDEGFGSLDQDTLYQVLDQLDRLRAGNRAVGVVSHVTEMKESIPDRIEVRRQSDSTSTIQRVG